MPKTQQQIADELNSLRSQAVNIVSGTIASAANPGGSITFTYVNPIDHQPYTATGTAWNQCVPSKVSALKQSDGTWIVVGQHEAAIVREAVHTDRRARPKPETGGKIKILFSVVEGNDRVFYVGGDRATPKKIYTISKDLSVVKASLNNAGEGDRYVVGLQWYSTDASFIETYHTTSITNGKIWETENIATSGYDVLGYYGFDFWAQEIARFGLAGMVRSTTTVTTQLADYNTPNGSVVGAQFLDAVDYFAAPLHIGTISGSGQFRRISTTGPTTVLDGGGERLGGAILNSDAQDDYDYSFSVTYISYYKGVMTQISGSSISYHEDLTDHKLQSYWGGGPISGNQTGGSLRSQTVQSQVAPSIVKVSLSTAQASYSSSSSGFQTVSENNTFVQTRDTKEPLLVGDQGQSLYQQSGYTSTYSLTFPSNGSSTESSSKDYYLATTQGEVKLGGELFNDPELVNFRVSDNLINRQCYRVQLDSAIFGKTTKPDVDVYSLSANSTQRRIKSKMYKIPKPLSGMPTDTAGLLSLTNQLKGGQPVTIGNITIYNASYHP